ncbi:F-box only protein 32 [Planococcus citri]|uniref:F-box only protein 32 n=1 Tax=Planococcus citri TaxID=170843 RepID=UPI0031F92B58
MPFISKDWRSPGEEWVKTEEGWEKKKILECSNLSLIERHNNFDRYSNEENTCTNPVNTSWMQENCLNEDDDSNKENQIDNSQNNIIGDGTVQPHCHITIKCTKEIAGFNGLSDAFKRLDFKSAVHDVRRFNYICKLLDLLITYKLPALSGCAQKVLFKMLEEVAQQVSTSQQNIHLLNKLLDQLRLMINCACWGYPLGSTQLWENHLNTINRIVDIANSIQIREPSDESFPKLENLPEECVREILLRLADHKDLEASSKAYSVMARVCDEQRIWRELCCFHFTQQQINFVLDSNEPRSSIDWQRIYHKLRKAFGLREEYAEIIQLCRNCRCLFWKSIGHPCIADKDPNFGEKLQDVDKNSLHVPIPPQAFLTFFSL